jgi:hypothetical protein
LKAKINNAAAHHEAINFSKNPRMKNVEIKLRSNVFSEQGGAAVLFFHNPSTSADLKC